MLPLRSIGRSNFVMECVNKNLTTLIKKKATYFDEKNYIYIDIYISIYINVVPLHFQSNCLCGTDFFSATIFLCLRNA